MSLVSSIIVPDEIFCLSAFLCFSLQYKCACVLCFHPDAIRVSLFYLLTHPMFYQLKKKKNIPSFLVFIKPKPLSVNIQKHHALAELNDAKVCACKSDVCLCVCFWGNASRGIYFSLNVANDLYCK